MWSSFFVGFIVYCIVANTSGIQPVRKHNGSGQVPKNFQLKTGMILAIVIIILLACNLIHGFLFTKKYKIPNNDSSYAKESGLELQ